VLLPIKESRIFFLSETSPYLVDIGIWGEPKVPNYRNKKTMAETQRFLGYPSIWGTWYLPRSEIRNVYNYPNYQRIRAKYGAEGILVHIEDKGACVMDLTLPDQGPLKCWRIRRSWRSGSINRSEFAIILIVLSVLFGVLGLLLWSATDFVADFVSK